MPRSISVLLLALTAFLMVQTACSDDGSEAPRSVGETSASEVAPAPAMALDDPWRPLEDARVIDLTHAYGDDTIYWPTETRGFQLEVLFDGMTDGGYHYAANAFCTAEHGGTHLDAPVHFYAGADTAEAIPLDRLMGPAVVIDIAEQCAADPDRLLTRADVDRFEAQHGPIAAGSLVLLRTGWSARWPDRRAYLGDDTPGDASNLHFPSYGEEAARFLIEERRISALGVDTASIDGGTSTDFMVHRVAGAANVPGFENLRRLDELPPTGAYVVALPMKIGGGSGAPVRVVAFVAG